MTNEILMKVWSDDDKEIKLYLDLDHTKLRAEVYVTNEKQKFIIPHEDIDIPKEIKRQQQLLSSFLRDAYVHNLVQCSNRDYKLYLRPRLRGAGILDFCFSMVLITTGVSLGNSEAAALWFTVGIGLFNAGLNGAVQAIQSRQNFDEKYLRSSAAGFVGGAVIGGMNSVANNAIDYVNHSAALNTIEISSVAMGNAAAQVTSDLIHGRRLYTRNIAASAVLGGAGRAFVPQLRSSPFCVLPHQVVSVGQRLFSGDDKAEYQELQDAERRKHELESALKGVDDENTACLVGQEARIRELEAIKVALLLEKQQRLLQQQSTNADAAAPAAAAAYPAARALADKAKISPRAGNDVVSAAALTSSAATFQGGRAVVSIKQKTRKLQDANREMEDVLNTHGVVQAQARESAAAAHAVIDEYRVAAIVRSP